MAPLWNTIYAVSRQVLMAVSSGKSTLRIAKGSGAPRCFGVFLSLALALVSGSVQANAQSLQNMPAQRYGIT
ncbi:MAG: hypothetical protein C0507_16505, partial [Cyanobacteria bacterium PR.3.49]|nr:hypothetical protein [Cyanobacteria bacterium PR.3.49]